MKSLVLSFLVVSSLSLTVSCAAPTTSQVASAVSSASPKPGSSSSPVADSATPTPNPVLNSLTEILNSETFYKVRWSLAIRHADAKYKPKEHKDVANAVKGGLTDSRANDDEKKLHDKYRASEVAYLETLFLMGDEIPYFLYGELSGPFRIGQYKDKQVIVLSSVGVDITFNTLRLDAKARAKNAISSYIIPEIDDLYKSFKAHADIEYFAIALTHGSRDFSNNSVVAGKEEMVAFVSDRKTIEAFINGETTDNEFISASVAFQSDEKASADVRRIDLVTP